MSRPYDDDRYLEWYSELQRLISEYLDTEGNDARGLQSEVDNAIENATDD